MSYSTYAPTFKIPEGFPELLAQLTTEVLRTQPEDAIGIYKFAHQFFLKKQEEEQQNNSSNINNKYFINLFNNFFLNNLYYIFNFFFFFFFLKYSIW